MLDALGKREEAKEKFQSLCDNKNLEGCRLLGVFEYRAGNRDLAWKIFDKACKKKHFPSCGFLGGLEMRAGKLESGLNLLKSACQNNVLDACESLAFQYSKAKDDSNLKTTMAKIKKMLESQCDAGKPEACRRLASLR
jgi:TPR repeat protein